VAHDIRGKKSLTEDDDGDDGSRLHRRDFLAVSSIAAASVTGYFTGSAEAATTGSSLGYGTKSYGVDGYGALETTN